jgi:hypothetical protein
MGGNMQIRTRGFVGLGVLLTLGAMVVLLTTLASAATSTSAQHVRWDIIGSTGIPAPIIPGGQASATAPDGDTITLTGSGHFVAPASGGGSAAVDGGGTWTTSGGGGGTYEVTALVSWENAGAQTLPPGIIDNIDEGKATNGVAVLKIAFSDGKQGVLTVGCHGPGAPPGIFEGIATTKGFKTYYNVQPPSPGVVGNRTIFHVR